MIISWCGRKVLGECRYLIINNRLGNKWLSSSIVLCFQIFCARWAYQTVWNIILGATEELIQAMWKDAFSPWNGVFFKVIHLLVILFLTYGCSDDKHWLHNENVTLGRHFFCFYVETKERMTIWGRDIDSLNCGIEMCRNGRAWSKSPQRVTWDSWGSLLWTE